MAVVNAPVTAPPPARRRRRFALAVALIAIFSHTSAAAQAALEYAVKAAYLYKFGAFVEWPDTAFISTDMPAEVCVVGADPFGNILDEAVVGQHIGSRPIVVRRIDSVPSDSGCAIMFVGGSDTDQAARILDAARGEAILTITDGARNPEATGIINFVVTDNRVRFEIDDEAAAVNGLAISSKLLSLATSVRRRG